MSLRTSSIRMNTFLHTFKRYATWSRHSKLSYCTDGYKPEKVQKMPTRNVGNEQNSKDGSFAESLIKQAAAVAQPKKEEAVFTTLLKNSKFIDLGFVKGNIVVGTIYHVVENDLYIDFGWKFHTVCTRPAVNGELYIRGAKVKLQIIDLELSTRFIGDETDLTLSEADCVLLGLFNPPHKLKAKHDVEEESNFLFQ